MKNYFIIILSFLSSLSFASGPGGGTSICSIPYYESRHGNGKTIMSHHGVDIKNDTNKSYTYSIIYSSWIDQGYGERKIALHHFNRIIGPGESFQDSQQIAGFFSTPDKGHFKTYARTHITVQGKDIMPACNYANKFRSY